MSQATDDGCISFKQGETKTFSLFLQLKKGNVQKAWPFPDTDPEINEINLTMPGTGGNQVFTFTAAGANQIITIENTEDRDCAKITVKMTAAQTALIKASDDKQTFEVKVDQTPTGGDQQIKFFTFSEKLLVAAPAF